MFEFGDELIIDSYRIPWLIWIQLLAMFLLVIIIYYFTTESVDDQFSAFTASASPSFASRSVIGSSAAAAGAKVRENEITETGTNTGGVVQRARKSNTQQSEGSDTMDDGTVMIFERSHHPCNFLGLAKQAFLKCLGIDSTPESSTGKQHE